MSQEISLIRDADFLHKMDLDRLKKYWVKILVMTSDEQPIRAIEGRVQGGSSININGDSAVRRTANITFVAEHTENDLEDVDNLLAMNRKIKLMIGFENNVDTYHDNIVWFQLGVFVIVSTTLQHSNTGITAQLSLKDKMCLLNGECGGNLPTSVTFDHYDQIVGYRQVSNLPSEPNDYTIYEYNGKLWTWSATEYWKPNGDKAKIGDRIEISQRLFDIIQTCVCNFGGEQMNKIIINDVPLEIKNTVRYLGKNTVWYNKQTSQYTLDENIASARPAEWARQFNYNDDCGYIYTDLIYPESNRNGLVSNIGDNVCSVLEKVKNVLGNYEYFYDVEGNFIFQEKKNYMNTSYDATLQKSAYEQLKDEGQWTDMNFYILNKENCRVDFTNSVRSVYTFDEGSELITSYSNSPNYANVKNDFHIWGKNQDQLAIHYHLAIKQKPEPPYESYKIVKEKDGDGKLTGRIHIAGVNDDSKDIENYTPTDWRAAIYMKGLDKKTRQIRPDIYEQELLDLFDDIYDMANQTFKADIVFNPNALNYWFDYINPAELFDISVDVIGSKIYSYQQDNIKRLYTTDVPNVILIGMDHSPELRGRIETRCHDEGQPYANVSQNIYNSLGIGSVGYAAQEVARDLLYQYTNCNSSISLSTIPIYYLEPNTRITVNDRGSKICGDYIIKSISLPLDAKNNMTISATRALDREQ